MAHRETKKPSSADKYKATEAAFKMLYDRIGHHEKQMKETSHSEFSLTALSKFTYTLTQYFDKCQNLAQILLDETGDQAPWYQAKECETLVMTFTGNTLEY